MNRKVIDKSSGFNINSRKKMLSASTPFGIRETYGAIRTQLMFSRKNDKCPIFAITSTSAGDGKSLNCINIAISFANLNKRVLIIDADMRKPTIHRFFSLSHAGGLSELLAGFSDSANVKNTPIENLSVITSGEIPPNPAELLASERFGSFLRSASESFDYIIIDTPPVGLVTDAAVLAQKVTGFVVVVRPGVTDVNELKAGISDLQTLGGNITGFICNDANGKMKKSRRYGNKYYSKYNYRYGRNQEISSNNLQRTGKK